MSGKFKPVEVNVSPEWQDAFVEEFNERYESLFSDDEERKYYESQNL
jgi:hypothetical protein